MAKRFLSYVLYSFLPSLLMVAKFVLRRQSKRIVRCVLHLELTKKGKAECLCVSADIFVFE
jgi:hypothetical protein